jgi:hypothetical protein
MFASIGLWFAKSALMMSPVGGMVRGAGAVIGKLPRQFWYALIVIAIVVGGYFWVKHQIHAAYDRGYKDGYTQARNEDIAAAAKQREAALAWKKRADDANETIRQKEQALHDQTVASNRALADALRVRVHNAQVQPAGGGGQAVPGAAAAADRHSRPQPQADAAVAGGAAAPRVCVDAGRLIDYAEQADNDHDALIRIEDAWRQYQANQPR